MALTSEEERAMKKLLTVLAGVMVASGVVAGEKPIQLSLTPGIAIFDRSETIEGLTLSVWGENPQSGLALGIVNGSTGQSAGLSIGILNYADNYTGLQWGLVNYTKQDVVGWQGGFCLGLVGSVVNYAGGTMKGFQCGVVNYAGSLTGLQLGLVNYAAEAKSGAQIGLRTSCPRTHGSPICPTSWRRG